MRYSLIKGDAPVAGAQRGAWPCQQVNDIHRPHQSDSWDICQCGHPPLKVYICTLILHSYSVGILCVDLSL